ncbi:type II secretion system secretin GspD [Tahibacter amnicola]|uniref:Type II secretion system secretin GspD n=1 Tax=Tahibacter amnicola TaxID=2976241 RepID=A0ABY6BGE0_9GAMM|nr:type II secretion system secretin GspD [Tahibacter amnicola]UXI69096.1 type II secretion system secretin GspD [Tahibacter amnicola]
MTTASLRGIALVLALALAAPAVAQPPPSAAGNPPGTHTLNLKDADIQALIATVSEITGRNFIVGPNVQGKVSVISAKPMQPDEIYDVFLSVLRVHGYAAVSAGSMIKIVPEAMAQAEGGNSVATAESGDAIVTQIVPLRHVAAAELVPILRPLLPQGAQLIAHQTSNSLVISDRASNVQRVAGIIARIDTVSDAEVEVIPLEHANAAEMARTLTILADDKAAQAAGESPRILADERTNSILIAGAKSGRLRMRTLVTHLDTPLQKGGDTNVVYLRYAKAKDLVPILTGVAATLNNEAPPKEGAAANNSNATIQAHEETNALVISAAPAVFRSLEGIVRQLDVRRAQVLIEAVIAEVASETAREIGVQWFTAPQTQGDKIGQGVIGGQLFNGPGGQPNLLQIAADPTGLASTAGGLTLGYVDGVVNIGGKEILNLGAMIRALQGDGRSNVLSTPSVLTLDNQEAIIKVAQEVPFKTGQYTNATGTTGGTNQALTPFQTIERKDVGLTLKVTPHVNEGDSVRLDLHHELSSLAPSVAGAVDLVTNKRELSTSVLVADNATLVLGGLMDHTASDTNNKVPGLGSIPVLGNLFKYRNNNVSKRDLMIFLHPRILRDAATEQAVSSEKYNYIRTEQIQMRQNRESLTPRSLQPVSPEMHDFLADPDGPAAPAPAKAGAAAKPARGKK